MSTPLPSVHPEPLQAVNAEAVRQKTVAWLERAVIGLKLCPFAKAVHVRGQIRYALCETTALDVLMTALEEELMLLHMADPMACETTLLIAPNCLQDFLDYSDFLRRADKALRRLGLKGVLQIASFHPDYQFAGSQPDDVSNCTNRSPYPTLHLLREASLDRAVEAFPEASTIFEANIQRLEALGLEGWKSLGVGPGR
jgi:uncharacterized protein